MRRLGFSISCLAILLTACNEEVVTDASVADPSACGKVSFSLAADLRNETVTVRSSSVEEISTDEFWVEIFNSSGTRIFCELYETAKDKVLNVNSGDYRFLATYGNENGVGFDAPYYKAEEDFTVGDQQTVNVAATAKLANVKVKVVFSENLDDKLSYDTYYALVRNSGKKLRFNPGETRSGYIPAGNLEFVLYVQVNGVWKQYILPAAEYQPNDFVTFNVEVGKGEGDIVLKIYRDDTVEVVEETVEIKAEEVLPVAEPVIHSQGFGSDNTITYVEGQAEPVNELWLSSYAEGQFASAVLTLDCEALSALGLPASTDLVTADEATVAAFEAAGIWWRFSDDNTNLTISLTDAYNDVISKAEVFGYGDKAGESKTVAAFTLAVTGINGAAKHAEDSFSIVAEAPAAAATISWNDYDVWAKKIVNPVENVTLGEPSLFTLEGSADGAEWFTVGAPSVSGTTIGYGTIDYLAPGTTYYMRALYDGKYVASDVYSFTTEAAAQVGNAGFEEWTKMEDYTYDQTVFDTDNVLPYYKPWTSSQWWDTNATASMRNNITAAYTFFKTFPLVQYSTDAHSGKSAQLTVVNVGNTNSTAAGTGTNGTWYVGELFIGRGNDADYDGTWTKVSEGHVFESRPSSMTFWYEYDAYSDSDQANVKVEVRAADNTVLASNTMNIGEASSWTSKTVPLVYTVTDKRASMIYVYFKASISSDHSCAVGGAYLEVAGSKPEGDASRIKLSAALRIDDVQLDY